MPEQERVTHVENTPERNLFAAANNNRPWCHCAACLDREKSLWSLDFTPPNNVALGKLCNDYSPSHCLSFPMTIHQLSDQLKGTLFRPLLQIWNECHWVVEHCPETDRTMKLFIHRLVTRNRLIRQHMRRFSRDFPTSWIRGLPEVLRTQVSTYSLLLS